MKRIWNRIVSLWTKIRYRKILQTASVSVEHVLPTMLQVRHCHAPVVRYDSKVFSTGNAKELGDKIEAKRKELGYEDIRHVYNDKGKIVRTIITPGKNNGANTQ